MTFKSPILLLYILLFAGAFFWLAGRRNGQRLAPLAMLLFSLGIYAPWGAGPLCLVLAQAATTTACALGMQRRPERRRAFLWLGLAANLSLLLWAKYGESLFGPAHILGWRFATPPGLSFLTFIQVALLADLGLGRQGLLGGLNALQFQLFFPAMLSGPISRYGDVGAQLAAPEAGRFSWDNAARAVFLFSLGLFKKVVLADTLAPLANQGYALAPHLDLLSAWVCTLAYTLQIYFDFSGYSDMAIAVALLFNVRLPDNFASPYKAADIQDFWRRWHMTLGLFMRDYVYIPLGGGRRGLARKCLALLVVFLLVGAWHGVGWTFVVWGALHGLAMAAHACWRARGLRLPAWLGWPLTFLFVHAAWVFFRAPDMPTALSVLEALAGLRGAQPPAAWALAQTAGLLPGMAASWPLLALLPLLSGVCLWRPNSMELLRAFAPSWRRSALAAGALALGLLYSGGGPQFLYFQF